MDGEEEEGNLDEQLEADERLQPGRSLASLHQNVRESLRVPIKDLPNGERVEGLGEDDLPVHQERYGNVRREEAEEGDAESFVHGFGTGRGEERRGDR